MDKIKKFLYIPIAYHLALFVTMAFLTVMKSTALGFIFLLELSGVIISPVFYAVLSMCNAVINGDRVYDLFKISAAYLLVIGVMRIVFYFVFARGAVLFSIAASIVALAVFCLWIALFSLTDKMMKKRPKRKYRK